MKRKQTILIAALVNSAFLVTLFSTAIQSRVKREEMQLPQFEAHVAAPPLVSTDGSGYQAPVPAHAPPALELPDPLLNDVPDLHPSEPLATAPAKPNVIPEVEPKVAPQGDYLEVIVKKGDILEKIARANGTSVSKLMEINHLKSPWLRIGQKLLVPKQSARREPRAIESSPEFYTVKKGDNLWIIASKFKVKVSDLKRLNHLDDESAKRLKVNDQLRIR